MPVVPAGQYHFEPAWRGSTYVSAHVSGRQEVQSADGFGGAVLFALLFFQLNPPFSDSIARCSHPDALRHAAARPSVDDRQHA